ncbi:hypothetical protein [Kitasatospora sp. GP82]|uniref:hypothetical protein n=1 Tax=Kitasatospora sp. GP82 TaxID=3035089 RepID=UPI002473532C|nr:hypothetical protein [Kitasatospora sp. GP82]
MAPTVAGGYDRAGQPPETAWTARIVFPPSEAVVTLEGSPRQRGGSPSPSPTPSSTPTTAPTATPPTATPAPTAAPTGSGPAPAH